MNRPHPLVPRNAPSTTGHSFLAGDIIGKCSRACCWTPVGHSTVLDHLPPWHSKRCKCHDPKEEA